VFLTITSTAPSATDLGYLLHKHPDRAQQFDEPVGRIHVFYPQADDDRCTVALLLEVDPIGLVRRKNRNGAFALAEYVNDRPYAASSMLAVALSRAFRSALAGRCPARPELVEQRLPLEIHLPALPCRGGAGLVHELFAPLGWSAQATEIPLDPTIPEWGPSPYVDLRLTGEMRLADALSHLYVLLPVLDDAKHYWVGEDEVEKLLRAGARWLGTHPSRELITQRYLAHQRSLVTTAVGRLAELDDAEPEALDNAVDDVVEEWSSLATQRRAAVLTVLREADASRVVDFGCGEGALLRELIADSRFTQIVGVDVSDRALKLAERRLNLDRLPDRQRDRIRLLQSSLTYRDQRLAGFDAGVLMEVVEHVDATRLDALERSVFGYARPTIIVVSTPNVEYNIRFADLPAGAMRHPDHRFEWSRAEFQAWAERVAGAYYSVRFLPVGPIDPVVGPPTQLAVFSRSGVGG
jgi:3' terminal RNA ribose 2'-O-methyltransferase Hen1